jgi:hypothetical protein
MTPAIAIVAPGLWTRPLVGPLDVPVGPIRTPVIPLYYCTYVAKMGTYQDEVRERRSMRHDRSALACVLGRACADRGH